MYIYREFMNALSAHMIYNYSPKYNIVYTRRARTHARTHARARARAHTHTHTHTHTHAHTHIYTRTNTYPPSHRVDDTTPSGVCIIIGLISTAHFRCWFGLVLITCTTLIITVPPGMSCGPGSFSSVCGGGEDGAGPSCAANVGLGTSPD